MILNRPSSRYRLDKYHLELISFLSGAVVMILELVGTRILAPYYGTSINSWTVLIGIVLGSLSIGYWYGGKMADKQANNETLAKILFFAGLYLLGIALLKDFVIYQVGRIPHLDLVGGSVFSTLILFFIPNILLGMVSPYIVKLKLKSLLHSGTGVGNLYAISTLGSIVGTFLAGFVLIPLLGVSKIIVLISIILLLTSILLSHSRFLILKLFVIACSILLFYGFVRYESFAYKAGVIDLDSQYGRILVFNTTHPTTHVPSTYLITGPFGYQSSKSNGVSPYITSTASIIKGLQKKEIKKMLVIGGGAFSLPDYFLNTYPSLQIDSVEIDPKISYVASLYFHHINNERLHSYTADGRIFLNNNKKRYDLIFNDAFTDIYPPFHLITQEALKNAYQSLNMDGIYISNVISPLEGKNSKLFQAVYKTYSSVFSNVLVFPLQNGVKNDVIQNILVVGIKTSNPDLPKEQFNIPLNRWNGSIVKDIPILSDDYAPVESYLLPITTQKPTYPMSKYYLDMTIRTTKKFLSSLF